MGRKRGRRRAAFKLKLKKETVYSLAALAFILFGALLTISFAGQGELLISINQSLVARFGFFPSLVVPFFFVSGGLMFTQLKWRITKPTVLLGSILIFIALVGLLKGGETGSELYLNLAALIQPLGANLVLLTVGVAGVLVITESSLNDFLLSVGKIFSVFKGKKSEAGPVLNGKAAETFARELEGIKIKGGQPQHLDTKETKKEPEVKGGKSTVKPEDKEIPQGLSTDVLVNNPSDPLQVYKPPPLDLLEQKMGGSADRGDIKQNATIIERTLDSFGIQARVVEVNLGPAVTQYALEIALGTKLSRITTLQNDLALALAAPTGQIRIEAPIPGRAMVGIEIPNRKPEFVSLRSMLSSPALKKNKSKTAVGLGLNVAGEAAIADIAKMPHALIAGATGSGKSVSVNAIIMQIIYRASPEEVKFIMVDPKRVELTGYNSIPHLLTPVIVEPDKVLAALNWAVVEMERRYKLFAEVGVRNIEGFNESSGFQALPYIIVIIDELADIMLFAPSKVEDAITRLAQMARATGIHLLLATQRPSVDVLTGLIKANVPCRIAFNVTSMIDSRVIIDGPGAEKLLGKGDMLFIPPDQAKPSRIQGAYVTDAEIKRVIDYLKEQGLRPEFSEEVTTKFAGQKGNGGDAQPTEADEMFNDALEVVIESQKASASYLQRRLSIGYSRAARIMDQLQETGIVSAGEGAKPRQVMYKSLEDYEARQASTDPAE